MELNPTHPVTAGLHDHWHKLMAIAMRKQGLKELTITVQDLEAVATLPEMPVVVADARKNEIRVILFESERAAREYVAARQGRG